MSVTAATSPFSPSQSPFWDVVDAAVVINLDHRADRWERIRAHLKSIVPDNRLHRVSAVSGKLINGYQTSYWFRRTRRPETWAGRAGCSVSHRNAMRLALERGWNWVLIIEDDAQFVRDFDGEFGQKLAAFLSTQGDAFGFVYLGFSSPTIPSRRIQALDAARSLYQIGGCSTTHAYLVNQAVMRRLLLKFPRSEDDIWAWIARHVVIDRWYSLNLYRWTSVAAVSPQITIQEPSVSDITLRASDYCEDPNVDSLRRHSCSSTAWAAATLLRSIGRPVTSIPRTVRALVRRRMGF